MVRGCSKIHFAHSAEAQSQYLGPAAPETRNWFDLCRAAFAPSEESKVVSSLSLMMNFRRVMQMVMFAVTLLPFAGAVPAAYGQFALTAGPFQPSAVDPGGSATATINLTNTTVTPFTGTVDFTCAVTSSQVTTDLPACAVSPTSETGASTPSLTITTTGSTPAGTYEITVTGTDSSTSTSANVILFLNVADLAQGFTLTVYPTTALPSPVVAGSVATTTVTLSTIGGYSGTVYFSCLSVSPAVAGAPTCSFNPSHSSVSSGGTATTTLTLTSYGVFGTPSSTTSKLARPRSLFAFWLAIPALSLAGLGASGRRRKKVLGVFLLFVIAGALLSLPACGASAQHVVTNVNQITPPNTYTFTITGSDQNGIGPSSTTLATVTLQVNAQQ
jgi:hypothetical protein